MYLLSPSQPGSSSILSLQNLDALMDDLETYRFVLTEGRFISADGFEILDGGSVAVPDKKKTPADGILTLALTWADEGCPGTPPIKP